MYFSVDADGIVLSVNRFGADRLGYAPQELIGSSVVAVFHPVDQDAVRRNLASCLSDVGHPSAGNCAKSGRTDVIWVRETAQAAQRTPDPVVLIVCEDINAMKEAEMALRQRGAEKPDPAQQRRPHQGSGSGRAVTIHERRGTGTAANRTCCGIHRQALVGVLGGRRPRCRHGGAQAARSGDIGEIRRVLPHHQRAAEVVGCTGDPHG